MLSYLRFFFGIFFNIIKGEETKAAGISLALSLSLLLVLCPIFLFLFHLLPSICPPLLMSSCFISLFPLPSSPCFLLCYLLNYKWNFSVINFTTSLSLFLSKCTLNRTLINQSFTRLWLHKLFCLTGFVDVWCRDAQHLCFCWFTVSLWTSQTN